MRVSDEVVWGGWIKRHGLGGFNLMKRLFDILLSCLLLLVFGIPILLVALMVKITSKGPALYASDRVGINNLIFKMYKFRTMKTDTLPVATHLMKNPEQYLTPIGKFLRKTSLD